ncbi:alpha-(1,3)-fucosyltransferase C-like [Mercenaria mercenaria]|uniref:alpha-(1,3)-fucosyltransferase C-like n=1 Tax=Mercenaria mercenaria TaxID=6596 RepID=UPI00234F057D|nr:alpha-(1,3)-fucosyltransferase C-like [Mercenaria mercenaria]XP_045215432.2 alpha-(1,3)-fucosyltransferase C-like [Mercenaria mercenaria]XP_045215433.2 alpha-(1,3)-fucosyltransferase C-like [Mercenaria mercenaria]
MTERLSYVPPLSREERNPEQVWIFFYSESPVHHFRIAYRHDNWRNTMNWSMSYNMDADVFCPHGVLESKKEIIESNYSTIFNRKTKLVAWAVSHCGARSKRDEFVSELSSYGIQIYIFGKCGDNSFYSSSELKTIISRYYKFYLSFENSLCKDYITEKFFAYYDLDVVLIVRGGLDYDRYLPIETFINTAHFNSAEKLANYIHSVGSSEEAYVSYLRQKDRYTAKHIYQIPLTPCTICEKLNRLNESRKTFEDHVSYIHQKTCWNPIDITPKSLTWLKFAPIVLLIFSICLFLIVWKCSNLTLLHKRLLNACSKV